jgi:neuropeptide Y receptor
MSMQMLYQLEQNSIAALAALISRSNFSQEIKNNLSLQLVQLERDLRESNIEQTIDNKGGLFHTPYGTWENDDYISDGIKIFFYWIYFIIFVIGITGNVLVCYVFITNKSMHTVTNLFISNLALSDIILCLFAVPFTPLYLITFKAWVFGSALCHLVPYVQGVSVYISAFTLMSIAIDRFLVIIYPFKARMKMYVCALIIIAVWIIAAAFTLPYGYYVQIIESPHHNTTHFCDEIWPSEDMRRIFGISTTMLQFIVPVVIISFCYIRVCCKLSDKTRIITGAKSARKEELERERTSRTNRMLISMVIIFGISWLPLNCYNLLLDFHIQAARWNYSRALFLLAHAIAMSSTCYNPLLYAWLNENFRKEFKSVLPCWRSTLAVSNSSRKVDSNLQMNDKLNELNNTSMKDNFKDLEDDQKNDDSQTKFNFNERATTAKYLSKSSCVVLEITNADNHKELI